MKTVCDILLISIASGPCDARWAYAIYIDIYKCLMRTGWPPTHPPTHIWEILDLPLGRKDSGTPGVKTTVVCGSKNSGIPSVNTTFVCGEVRTLESQVWTLLCMEVRTLGHQLWTLLLCVEVRCLGHQVWTLLLCVEVRTLGHQVCQLLSGGMLLKQWWRLFLSVMFIWPILLLTWSGLNFSAKLLGKCFRI